MAQKTQKKRKFNFIDLIIVLLIVGVIGAAAYIFGAKKLSGGSDTVGVEYVLEFRQVRDEFLDCFESGVDAVDAAKKYRLGEITAVESSASIYTGNDLVDGKLVYHNYPEHSDVRVTVKSTATIDSKGMYILDGGYRISVGSVVYVRTPGYTGTSYCISINRTEK